MNNYLLLEKISVQNANAIAGLTYGFPAITHFLGFVQALSRKLDPILEIRLNGVAVISHKNSVQVHQPKKWGDYVFAQTRNPLTKAGKTAPINQEGRMAMQISLLVKIEGLVAGDRATEGQLLRQITQLIPTLRLAGGQIITLSQIELLCNPKKQQAALYRLMPGFVLLDRSSYLNEHFIALQQQDPTASLFDAWCDFSKIQYQAQPDLSQQSDGVEWQYIPKPYPGYLVPVAVGYCAISPLYSEGTLKHCRDQHTPARFAEMAYSVAEWRSVHVLEGIADALWFYQYSEPWYLAKAEPFELDIQ